jgi:hypothetical protein
MSVGSSYILKRVEIAVGKSKVHNDFPRRLRKRTSVGVSESFTKATGIPARGSTISSETYQADWT